MGFIKGVFLFLIFIALVVTIPVALTATWARQEIYDEDKFVASLDDLYADAAVQDAIADAISREVSNQSEDVDWATFADRVAMDDQTRADLIALDEDIDDFVHAAVIDALQSDQFDTIWETVIREIHAPISQLLKGEDTALVQTTDGIVRIDLRPIYDQVNETLAAQGIDLTAQLPATAEGLQLTVFDGEQLVKAQKSVETLNKSLTVAYIVIGIMMMLILLFTRNKSRALVTIGLAIVFGMTLELAALFLGGGFLGDRMSDVADQEATKAIFSEVVSVLLQWTLVGIVVGAIVMVLGMIVGQRADNKSRSVYPR